MKKYILYNLNGFEEFWIWWK